MIQKINIGEIVSGHLETLADDRNGSKFADVLLFYGSPCLVTAWLVYTDVTLSSGAIDVCTSALSILAGLLFNLLVVLQGLSAAGRTPKNQRVRNFTKSVYNNIAYAIVISLVAIVPLIFAANYDDHQRPLFKIAAWVSSALVIHFGLTMIMILKRMYKMLQAEFDTVA